MYVRVCVSLANEKNEKREISVLPHVVSGSEGEEDAERECLILFEKERIHLSLCLGLSTSLWTPKFWTVSWKTTLSHQCFGWISLSAGQLFTTPTSVLFQLFMYSLVYWMSCLF